MFWSLNGYNPGNVFVHNPGSSSSTVPVNSLSLSASDAFGSFANNPGGGYVT